MPENNKYKFEYTDAMVRFYDTVYANLRDNTDHAFYLEKILETEGPVLEIGAGTGRLFCDALSKGADIYGIDYSDLMLSKLKSKIDSSEHYRVKVDDARTVELDKRFKLIISPFRVFSHMLSIEDQVQTLSNIKEHLADDGRFIFDLFNPNPAYLIEKEREPVMDFDGEYEPGKKLQRIVSIRPDNINQVNHVTFTYRWEEDGSMKEDTSEFPMRYYYRYEIEHLIARSGLKLEAMYGDFKEGKLENGKWEFVMVCSKT